MEVEVGGLTQEQLENLVNRLKSAKGADIIASVTKCNASKTEIYDALMKGRLMSLSGAETPEPEDILFSMGKKVVDALSGKGWFKLCVLIHTGPGFTSVIMMHDMEVNPSPPMPPPNPYLN